MVVGYLIDRIAWSERLSESFRRTSQPREGKADLNSTSETKLLASWCRACFWAVFAGLGGYVLNGFPIEVYSGVHFIWGGLLSVPVSLVRGPGWGLVAAVIASSRTVGLWGHPYAWVTLSLEGLVVGWLVRRKREPLTAGLLYWGVLGMPLVAVFYFFVLQLPVVTSWTVLFKQPLNSLITLVCADAFLRVGPIRRALGVEFGLTGERPLRASLSAAFALIMVAPMTMFGLLFGQPTLKRLEREANRLIQEEARSVADGIQDRLERHRQAMIALSDGVAHMGDFTRPVLNRWLEDFHATHPTFLTMLAASRDGRLAGVHPLQDEAGLSLLDQPGSVADRPYFSRPLATGEVYISDVFWGRGFGRVPIVAISAPVRSSDGGWWGIVEGSLDLAAFGTIGAMGSLAESTGVVLVDEHGRVVFTTETNAYPVMSDLSKSELMGASRSVPQGTAFEFGVDRPSSPLGRGYLGVRVPVQVRGMEGTWQVLTLLDGRRVHAPAHEHFAYVLGGMLMMFVLAGVVAGRAAAVVTRPLEELVKSIRGLDVRSERTEDTVGRLEGPSEVRELTGAFQAMAGQVRESYGMMQRALEAREEINRKLEAMVRELDRRVQERTDALRESEHLLATAQAHGHVGSWVAEERQGGRLVWSAETCRIFGVPPEAFDGDPETFFGLVHPDDRGRVRTEAGIAAALGVASEIEYRICRPDGEIRWLYQRADVEAGSGGAGHRRIGVVQDITDRRRAEELRGRLEAQLRHSQKLEAVGQLAGGFAHDFNNILASLTLGVELLRDEPDLPSGIRAGLDELAPMLERAASLTRQLLIFARRCVPECQVLDLGALVGEFPKSPRVSLGERTVLKCSAEAGPLWVSADPGMVEQMMANLVDNAQDAMPGGGIVDVEARAVVVTPEHVGGHPEARVGRFVRLDVLDAGRGMDEATLRRVFDPFFSTKEVGKGTGLGLSTVRGIVQQHGGWIEVESEPGRGTAFRIYLPQVEPPGVSGPEQHASSGGMADAWSRGKPGQAACGATSRCQSVACS